MIKVRILKESLHEELLDEAKEDDYWESYWNKHERDYRFILLWIYGLQARNPPDAQEMIARNKELQKMLEASGQRLKALRGKIKVL